MFKISKLYIVLIVVGFIIWFLINKLFVFVWVNPYTSTVGYSEISKTIKGIDKVLDYAKDASNREGKKINYLFENAYGSGFLNNNSIPNDLDFSIGIDLGQFEYNGENAAQIAESIIEKIELFQYSFNFYVNQDSKFYINKTQYELLAKMSYQHKKNIQAIEQSLAQALSGKDYIRYTVKEFDKDKIINLPYVMRKNEILIEEYDPITMYSDEVFYNKNMQKYMREISIIPEFFVKIKYNGKVETIELVPESYTGERLQLARRFFASSTFTGLKSIKFLKNLSYINNDEEYLNYRLMSYKRHLQEITNIKVMKDRPVKMLKRTMQTADIISPMLDEEVYSDISNTVYENLQNKDIQLLNEYKNICTNIYLIQDYPKLYLRLLNDGKIKEMYDVLSNVLTMLEEQNNIDPNSLKILKTFAQQDLVQIFELRSQNDVYAFKNEVFDKKFKLVDDTINSSVYSMLSDKEKFDKYAELFSKIYTDAGYHRVSLYWLDAKTMGILADDFTKNIKDLKKFAKENDLADVNYKLIILSQVPKASAKYGVWTRYNPTEEQQKNYEKLNKTLLNDKKNFNIKIKPIFLIK